SGHASLFPRSPSPLGTRLPEAMTRREDVIDLAAMPSAQTLSITASLIFAVPVTWSLWTSRASSMSLLICAGFHALPSQYHWRKASPAESTWTQRSPTTTPLPEAAEVERVMEFLPLAEATISAVISPRASARAARASWRALFALVAASADAAAMAAALAASALDFASVEIGR